MKAHSGDLPQLVLELEESFSEHDIAPVDLSEVEILQANHAFPLHTRVAISITSRGDAAFARAARINISMETCRSGIAHVYA